jgi:hypothetical protein
VRLTPHFLRALHLELFTKPSLRWLLGDHHIFINLFGPRAFENTTISPGIFV